MPIRYGGGGNYGVVRRNYGRYRSRRAQRYKRISRKIVAQTLETKYFPDPAIVGGIYRFGCNTTGNLCQDNSAPNVGAAYFCPFAHLSNGGALQQLALGSARIGNMEGNKIWLKSVRIACELYNPLNTDRRVVRVTCFQYHDWAATTPAGTGDAHFSKALVPFGKAMNAAYNATPAEINGLMPSLGAAGRFTILYDVVMVLASQTATDTSCVKFVNIKLNRGFKRLIEFSDSDKTIIRNPIVVCFYSDTDNDISSPNSPTVSIQCRIAFKDI